MKPADLEAARYSGSPLDLLKGVVHTGAYQGVPDMKADWVQSPRNYPFYNAISSLKKPSIIFEIGVRLGYSLISMFRGHPGIRQIIGVDIQNDTPDSQSKAAANLRAVGYSGELLLPTGDCKWFSTLNPDVKCDLAHVDAWHSAEGVQADINLIWPRLLPGGILIADDTDYFPEVKRGIEDLKASLPDLADSFYFPTFRGWWVGIKRS